MSDEQQPSKISATLKSYAGAAKEAMGSMFGSETKEAEGTLQKAQADAEYKQAQMHEAASGTADRMGKEAVGSMTGDEATRVKGKVEQAGGAAEQEMSRH